jgi:hypothetical protein
LAAVATFFSYFFRVFALSCFCDGILGEGSACTWLDNLFSVICYNEPWSIRGGRGALVNRAELQWLAKERIHEAKVLLDTQHWSGAYDLAGYAVECGALKACIAKRMQAEEFPDKSFADKCWTHILPQLLSLTELKTDFDAAVQVDTHLFAKKMIGPHDPIAADLVANRDGRPGGPPTPFRGAGSGIWLSKKPLSTRSHPRSSLLARQFRGRRSGCSGLKNSG